MSVMKLELRSVGSIIFGMLVIAVLTAGATRPAAAERGLACSYGSASYKRCCNKSYSMKPRLGWNARGRDIDACMSGGSRDDKRRGR